ncbi:beta strand repeat-containing protein [Tabrizicola oligotrophica]|uniref:Calcium-binding protein n=1 Tax=Tabrizicola oligotrophica TaxID=2710650 RepID=A0A6M0QVQ6_9RHOB|nr:calcium-binding protein [Tabrizicola oligotrophica]NEY91578.1 calcium-binding protein [Tabrizicola oligotrophica]
MALIEGGAGNDSLVSAGTADEIYGYAGDDTLDGGSLNDTLDGGTGLDSMTGGSGDDLYYVDDAGDTVVEAADGGNDTVIASVAHTLADNVEVLILETASSSADINGTGNALNNLIQGNESLSSTGGRNYLSGLAGDDTLYGYNGQDTLDGGTGNDVMYGGTGGDTFIVDSADDVVVELVGEGNTDTVQASISYTLTTPVTTNYIENITLTGTDNLTATGNGLDNTLIGNSGNNTLTGGAGDDVLRGAAAIATLGDDVLDGGAGSDDMTGGNGNDTYYVDTAEVRDANDVIVVVGDQITEYSNYGTDTVHTTIDGYTLGSHLENLIFGAGVVSGTGNGENNTLTGNELDNVLAGGTNADTLIGGAGNDTLDGGAGNDLMQGGAGNDVYKVNTTGDVTDESALDADGTDLVEATATHTLGAGIENLTITSATNISGTGNGLDNVLTGGDGNNRLDGGVGNDSLYGGLGADTLVGGAGVDSLDGGAGDDRYELDNTLDVVSEAADGGTDTVQIAADFTLADNVENLILSGSGHFDGTGNSAANTITGNGGDNALDGGAGSDILTGNAGNDYLDGGTGADLLTGGAGDDEYIVDDAGDIVVEAADGGEDWVGSYITYTLGEQLEHIMLADTDINATGNAKANQIIGGAGANLLSGLNGDDTLAGGDGQDTLNGGFGVDSMAGGAGNDTYIVDVLGDVLVENLDEGTDTVQTALAYTLADNFENLTLSGNDSVSGTGNAAANVLTGNVGKNNLLGLDGDDTLNGGGGADTLNGGAGADSMTGGAGADLYIVDNELDVVVEGEAAGIDTIRTIFSTTLDANVENLTLQGTADLTGTGNASANTIAGNAGANLLEGLAGNDTLTGAGGADTLDGGEGDDSMAGGAGDDTYHVDASGDLITEASLGGTDLVLTTATFTMGAGLEQLTMLGTDNLDATGNGAANTLTGNSGANNLKGGAGDDTLLGAAGADTLNGGTGADELRGGGGNDTYNVNAIGDVVIEGAGAGTDTVLASATVTLSANVENLTMLSTGTYSGTGNALANTITGNGAANIIRGLAGDDVLNGGGGADVLTGGLGADSFVFSSATAGNDTVTDFNALDGGVAEGDLLVFQGLLVGEFSYLGGNAFSGGADNSEARFDATTGKLLVDTDGDGTANLTLTLTGMDAAADLTSADFLWS